MAAWRIKVERDDGALQENEKKEFATRIASNARKLNRIVTDLLDMDRLSRGTLRLERQRTELERLVVRVLDDDVASDGSAFSAFATTRSTPSRAMMRGTSRCTAVRPGLPKTSPRNRTFTGGELAGLGGWVGRYDLPVERSGGKRNTTRASVTTASTGAS